MTKFAVIVMIIISIVAITVTVMVLSVTRSTITPRLQVADWVKPGD